MTAGEGAAAGRDSLAGGGLDDPFDVMMLGWSFMRSRVVSAALELGLFTRLGDLALTEEEIRARLGLHPRASREFLDALAAFGLLDRDGDRYRSSPAAARYLVPDIPGYVGGFLGTTTELLGQDQAPLTGLLRTGNARGQNQGGEVPFTRIFADPVRLEFFLGAMDSFSSAIGEELVKALDWGRYATISDIGGARGNLAALLVNAYPQLTGTVFDRPGFDPLFDRLVADRGVAGRLSYVGGDFFTDELPGADVLIMGGVLHDWPVEQRRALIGKAAAAVNPGGALVVYDTMLDEARTRTDSLVLSLIMMMQSAQATGFTPAACAGWLAEAGLEVTATLPVPAHNTALIARKPG
ncbi:MAG: methyltransferase [Streptomyces sp.]|nr:methyltransferase [Streptomyces sp.]